RSLSGIAEITHGYLYASFSNINKDGRSKLIVYDQVLVSGPFEFGFRSGNFIQQKGIQNLCDDGFCFFIVTVQGDKDRLFIPDIVEPLRIIGLGFYKNFQVRYMDESTCTLVGIHPVANLENGKLK